MSLRLPPIHPKTKSRLVYDLPTPKRKRLPKKVKIYNYSKIMKMNKITHLHNRYETKNKKIKPVLQEHQILMSSLTTEIVMFDK